MSLHATGFDILLTDGSKIVKGKVFPVQAVEALRVVRG
jgi:hypothetical protein